MFSSEVDCVLCTANRRYRQDFEFPLSTSGIVDEKKSKRTLGGKLPKVENFTDPMDWPQTTELFDMHDKWGTTRNPFEFKELAALLEANKVPVTVASDPQSALYKRPFEPYLEVES